MLSFQWDLINIPQYNYIPIHIIVSAEVLKKMHDVHLLKTVPCKKFMVFKHIYAQFPHHKVVANKMLKIQLKN